MTVYSFEDEKKPRGHKRKTIEVISALRRRGPLTPLQIQHECDVGEDHVLTTLHLLREYGLVRFAGYQITPGSRGIRPARWEWI